MQRKALLTLAIALAMGCASTALAQDDDLSGVTLRVLDDVSDVDAVVLAIDDERDSAAESDADGGETADADGQHRDGQDGDGAHGDRDDGEDADGDFDDGDRHDEDHNEGQIEDHDVVRDGEQEGAGDDHPDGEPVEP